MVLAHQCPESTPVLLRGAGCHGDITAMAIKGGMDVSLLEAGHYPSLGNFERLLAAGIARGYRSGIGFQRRPLLLQDRLRQALLRWAGVQDQILVFLHPIVYPTGQSRFIQSMG